MSVFVWWLSSPSFISQVLLYSTVNVTNASYFVLFERRCGSDGSGSSSTSLENLDEDFSSDEESPKKGKVCWNNTPRYVTWEGVGRGGILLKAFPPGECILLKLTKRFLYFILVAAVVMCQYLLPDGRSTLNPYPCLHPPGQYLIDRCMINSPIS